MTYYEQARALMPETVAHRRYLHAHPEAGVDLPLARAYVTRELEALGLAPKRCGHGIVATLGQGEKCILLRADMDALPMPEESGEPFASENPGVAHTCGHDLHAAMLLTAAKMLKEREQALAGRVKLMFQPGEEVFQGARDMLDHGLLEDPAVDVALALHVTPGRMPLGLYMYNGTGTMMASVDVFRIRVRGHGAHGAYPQNSVDPINIAVHVYLATQALIAREVDPEKMCVMTVGKFQAGTAANIIPEEAVLEGTVRTNDVASREKLVRRLGEVARLTAEAYGGTAQVETVNGVAPLICDGKLVRCLADVIRDMGIPGAAGYPGVTASASEDFAAVAERVPSAFFHISAGYPDERGDYPPHNPRVRFNEEALPMGAAIYAQCAEKWLAEAK